MKKYLMILVMLLSCSGDVWACQQYTYNVFTSQLDCVSNEAAEAVTYVNILSYGGAGDGTTNNSTAITTALAVNGTVFFPCGTYLMGSKVTLTTGQAFIGAAPANNWRGSSCTKLVYNGTDAAFEVKPSAGNGVDTVTLANLELDGSGASGSADGFRLDATAAGSYIEGIKLRDVTIKNFPRMQMHANGNVFQVDVSNSTLMNPSRTSGDHLYYGGTGGSPNYRSQITFHNSRLFQYVTTKWSFYETLATDVVFSGGTVAGVANVAGVGASGIYVNGGLTINGTHVEGLGTSVTATGVMNSGSNGAWINGAINGWSIGVQIGDSGAPSQPALNVKVSGNVGNNATDVKIIAGGQRVGCAVLGLGQPVGATTVTDLRLSTDGVTECMIQKTNFVLDNIPGTIAASNIASGSKQGTGSKLQVFGGGSPAANDCAKFDATGAIVSAGGACGVSGSGGEANTASNVGTAGVGVYKQKTAFDLEFKKVNAGSSKVTITDDTGNSEVDVDVAEANFNIGNMGGSLAASQVAAGSKQGTGSKLMTFGGGVVNANECVKFDATGAVVSAGVTCGSGGSNVVEITADNGIVVTNPGAGVRTIGFNTLLVPKYITGGSTIDFASISAGACITNTFTLTGAQTGQTVVIGRPATISSSLELREMWVSAVDTISVKLCNPTGGAIDPPSATYNATIVTSF